MGTTRTVSVAVLITASQERAMTVPSFSSVFLSSISVVGL